MNSTAVTRRAQSIRLRRLVESAMMLAIATVLSMFPFQGPWALGGGITVCSMLPLVVLSWRYGCKWGVFAAFVYSLLQMVLGIQNVQYADSVPTAILIILFDYVLAFSVIGLAGMFKGWAIPVWSWCWASCSPFWCALVATMSPAWWFGRCCGPMSWAGPRPSGPLPTTPAI